VAEAEAFTAGVVEAVVFHGGGGGGFHGGGGGGGGFHGGGVGASTVGVEEEVSTARVVAHIVEGLLRGLAVLRWGSYRSVGPGADSRRAATERAGVLTADSVHRAA